MATPLTAARFEQLARAAGIQLIGHGSWQTFNRGSRGTGWGPVNGVMIHHTVTRGLQSTLDIVTTGYDEIPGPLYAGLVDKDGSLHMVGWGRCNHAGLGDRDVLDAIIPERMPLPTPNEANTDGNSRFYGFSGINMGDGVDPWPGPQLQTLAAVSAVICRYHGWTYRSVLGHREWQPGKIDPYGQQGNLMPAIRASVGALLG